MRTSLTRLVAGTAIAATALLGAVGVASASTTSAKLPTTLSIVAAKSTITVGQLDAISGTLASNGKPVVHRVVELDVRGKDKKWHTVVEKYTSKSGKVTFFVRPGITTAYALLFRGGSVYKATHSGVVVVVVKPAPRVETTLVATPAEAGITAGSTDVIGGVLTATKDTKALPGQWVWLDTVVNGKLHPLHAFKTGKFGKVAFKVKPAATTTYELVYRGTKVLAPTVSLPVTVTVTAAS